MQLEQKGAVLWEYLVPQCKSKAEKFVKKLHLRLDKNAMSFLEKVEWGETVTEEIKVPVKDPNGAKGSQQKSEKEETPQKFEIQQKSRQEIRQIEFKSQKFFGLSPQQQNQFLGVEQDILKREQLLKEIHNSKYNLESFIYQTRSDLQEFVKLVPQGSAQVYSELLERAEDWIY